MVLPQSYRLPRLIQSFAQGWIRQLSRRETKNYQPRDAEGEIRVLRGGNYRYPGPVINDAERYLAEEKTVMFLASCSFMLEPILHALRERGIPFWNPYRKKRCDWNPLSPSTRSGRSTAVDRLLAFLGPWVYQSPCLWRGEEVRKWTAWLEDQTLEDGARDKIKKLGKGQPVNLELAAELVEPEAYEALRLALRQSSTIEGGVGWWLEHLTSKRRKTGQYPARVALRHGVEGLRQAPRLIVGTGHSVKGGEADVVFVFPDLSPSGARQWESGREGRDALRRLGYVMITRARETLVLCEPATSGFLPLMAGVSR